MRPHVQARRAGLQREHTHDAVVESRATSGTCQPLAAPARAGTRMLNIGHAGGGGDDDLPMVVARRARQPACRAEHAWVHDRRESHLTQPRVLVSLSAPLVHRFHSRTMWSVLDSTTELTVMTFPKPGLSGSFTAHSSQGVGYGLYKSHSFRISQTLLPPRSPVLM